MRVQICRLGANWTQLDNRRDVPYIPNWLVSDVPTTFVQPVMSPSHDVIVMTSQSPVESTSTTTLSPIVQCVSPTSLSPKSVAKPNHPELISHQPIGIKSQAAPGGPKSASKVSSPIWIFANSRKVSMIMNWNHIYLKQSLRRKPTTKPHEDIWFSFVGEKFFSWFKIIMLSPNFV